MSQVLVEYAIIWLWFHLFGRSDSRELEGKYFCIDPLLDQLFKGLLSTSAWWWRWCVYILLPLLFFLHSFSWLWGSIYHCHWGLFISLPCYCCFISLWCWYHSFNILCEHTKICEGLAPPSDEMGLVLRLSSIDTNTYQILLFNWFYTLLGTCFKSNHLVQKIFIHSLFQPN